MSAGEAWTDTQVCGHFGKGDAFTPFIAAGATDGKDRYVIHVPGRIHESERYMTAARLTITRTGGLETLAAEEVQEVPGCCEAICLQGKVLFASTAPLETLLRLRSAEKLALLCWATPAPAMPGEGGTGARLDAAGREPEAEFAPRSEFAAEFAAFYRQLEENQQAAAAAWLREFERAMRCHALPALKASLPAWCAATRHEDSKVISFRATVNRGGKSSGSCGVTSLLMERVLGGLVCESLRWRVDLKRCDVDVALHWNEAQVVLELPITNRYGERRMGERHFLSGGALSGTVGWALTRLARIPRDAAVILDPCVVRLAFKRLPASVCAAAVCTLCRANANPTACITDEVEEVVVLTGNRRAAHRGSPEPSPVRLRWLRHRRHADQCRRAQRPQCRVHWARDACQGRPRCSPPVARRERGCRAGRPPLW